MEHEWGKESCTDECAREERMGIIWLKQESGNYERLGRDLIEEGAICVFWGEVTKHSLPK
jgi:hypothetical protein